MGQQTAYEQAVYDELVENVGIAIFWNQGPLRWKSRTYKCSCCVMG